MRLSAGPHRALSLALLVVLCVSAAGASNSGAGTSGATFLRINPMARSAGMANAYTGLAEGIESLNFNAAGLTTIDKWDLGMSEVFFSRSNENTDINYGLTDLAMSYLALARRVSTRTVFGVNATYFGAKDETRNAAGATIGTFHNYDFALGGHVGYSLAPEISVGGSLRLIRSKLASYNATAMGMDVGVRYLPAKWPGIAMGASVQNIGTGIKYIAVSSPQPLLARVGVSWRPPQGSFVLAGDVSVDREGEARGNAGLEYNVTQAFCLRGGLELEPDFTLRRALRLGAGVHSSIGSFDYAYESQGDVGSMHRLSYSYRGGRPTARPDVRDTGSFFARTEASMARTTTEICLLPFTNLSSDAELDWLSEGLREIVAARLRKYPGMLLVDQASARYVLQGRYAPAPDGSLWIGVKVVDSTTGEMVAFREVTIIQENLIGSTTTFAGSLAAAIPSR